MSKFFLDNDTCTGTRQTQQQQQQLETRDLSSRFPLAAACPPSARRRLPTVHLPPPDRRPLAAACPPSARSPLAAACPQSARRCLPAAACPLSTRRCLPAVRSPPPARSPLVATCPPQPDRLRKNSQFKKVFRRLVGVLHWYAAEYWKLEGKATKFVTMTNAFRSAVFHLFMLHNCMLKMRSFSKTNLYLYSECIVVRKLACARFSYRIAQYADCCFFWAVCK
jgi:hypothetical protein